MCAGAIANARIKTLFYAREEKTSKDNLLQTILSSPRLNHKVEIRRCEGEEEASRLLQEFFKQKQQQKMLKKQKLRLLKPHLKQLKSKK